MTKQIYFLLLMLMCATVARGQSISGTSSVSAGQTVTYTASGSGQYMWKVVKANGTMVKRSLHKRNDFTVIWYCSYGNGAKVQLFQAVGENGFGTLLSQKTISMSTYTPSVSISVTSGSSNSCAGSSVTFSASNTHGGSSPSYQWKVNGSNVGSNSSTYSSSGLSDNAQVSCVMTSNSSACLTSSTATSNTITMNIKPIPAQPNVSGSSTNCGGPATLTMTASNSNGSAMQHLWYTAQSGGSQITSGISTSVHSGSRVTTLTKSFNSTTTYYVSTKLNGCESSRKPVTVTISSPSLPNVTASIPPLGNICRGDLFFGVDAGTVSQWAYSTSSSTSPAQRQIVGSGQTHYPQETGYYWATVSVPCGTYTVQAPHHVTILPLYTPSISVNGPSSVCSGADATFTASSTFGGSSPSYQWKLNGSNVGSNSPTYITSSLNSNDQISCVLTSNSTECLTTNTASSNTIATTVNPVPAPPGVYDDSNTTCTGTTITSFEATSYPHEAGTIHRWYTSSTGSGEVQLADINVEIIGQKYISTVTETISSAVTYHVSTKQEGTGCESNRVPTTRSVTSIPPPHVTLFGNPTIPQCEGDISFGVNEGTVSGWKFSIDEHSANPAPITGETGQTLIPTLTGYYWATITTGCGTNDYPAPHKVTILPLHTASAAIVQDDPNICSGDLVTFTATSTNGGDAPAYQWKVNNLNVGTNSATYSTIALQDGDVVSCLLTSNFNGCLVDQTVSSNDITLVVKTIPALTLDAYDNEICYGEKISFNVSQHEALSLKWIEIKEDDVFLTDGDVFETPALFASTTYKLIANYAFGETFCSSETELPVTVHAEELQRPNEPDVIKRSHLEYEIHKNNSDDQNFSYRWKDDYALTADPRVVTNPGTYTLTAINQLGCEGLPMEVEIADLTFPSYTSALNMGDVNYVRSLNYRVLESELDGNISDENQPSSKINVSTAYLDGLGRAIQQVSKQATPGGKDLVIPKSYDNNGNENRNFLPYAASTGDGLVKGQPFTDLQTFYTTGNDNATSDYPFSLVHIEKSPLRRAMSSAAPGEAWVGLTGTVDHHDVQNLLEANISDEVIHWEIDNGQLKKLSAYAAGTLYKTITTDENGKQVQEFKNLRGQVILKKVQLSETSPTNDDDWLQTYYVYDDFGNLRFVLPPMGTKNYLTEGQYAPDGTVVVSQDANFEDVAGPDQKVAFLPPASITINAGTTLNEGADIYGVTAATDNFILNQNFVDTWTFQYRYDERQRMIEKRVPGAGWVYMVYDNRDRLVLTQDANQRTDNEWLFTKYDQLNRPVSTGTVIDNTRTTRALMQSHVNAFYVASASNTDKYFEERGAAVHGYTNQSFPKEADQANDYLTVTYYDNYAFSADTHWTLGDYSTESQAKTLATGSKIRVDLPDGTYDWNETITLYDSRYRVSSTVSKDYQDNKDTFVNTYRNLVHARLDQTVHTHERQITGGDTEVTEITKDFVYDHADRLLTVTHTLDVTSDPTFTAVPKVILKNEYNELGELTTKKLNRESAENTPEVFSQQVDYKYNIRGWLTHINDPITPEAADYFNMQLKYDEAGQYNGNIGATSWKNPFETATNSYAYGYDPVNRITAAQYTSTATSGMDFDVNGISYDANGNIESLSRTGNQLIGLQKGLAGVTIDDLTYKYQGNQLTKVTDASSIEEGFKDGSNANTEYEYDANGNMIEDKNKGIDHIEYNHLNLPIKVDMQVGAGEDDRIEYIYDAAGIKQAQIVYEGGTQTKRTDYKGAFIYETKGTDPSQLQFIQHEEGRIVYNREPVEYQDVYEYQYHLKDHLGNVRATFKEAGQEDDETLTAYMEDTTPNDLEGESGYFFNYENIKIVDVAMLNSTPNSTIAGASHSMRLSGSDDERFGLNRQIKVKPGDKIDVSVQAKYLDPAVSSSAMTSLTNTIVGQVGVVGAFNLVEGALSPAGIGTVDFTGRTADETAPMAFLNAFVFDEHFNQKNLLSVQISSAAREDGSGTSTHEPMTLPTIDITESGYVYIYLSNEQATLAAGQPIEVFFDDLTVTQHHTPIVSKDDYYPFGLTFNSYSRPAGTAQNFNYNGKEEINDLGVNWHDYGARMYDAALGRWNHIDPLAGNYLSHSPYAYALNNPVLYIDPDGAAVEDPIKNVVVLIGEDHNLEEIIDDLLANGNENWTVKMADDFEEAASVIDEVTNGGETQLDNLVIGSHGFSGGINADGKGVRSKDVASHNGEMSQGDRSIGQDSNWMYGSDHKMSKARYSKISAMKNLASNVRQGGNVIFTACLACSNQSGKELGNNLVTAFDGRVNVFLNGDYSKFNRPGSSYKTVTTTVKDKSGNVIGTEVRKIPIGIIGGSMTYGTVQKGWTRFGRDGSSTNIGQLNLNLQGDPVTH